MLNIHVNGMYVFDRDLMRQKKITMEEGKEARKLLNMPGGLELHIGVSHSSY